MKNAKRSGTSGFLQDPKSSEPTAAALPFSAHHAPSHDGIRDLLVSRAALQVGTVAEPRSVPKRQPVASLYTAYYRSSPELFRRDVKRRPAHYDDRHLRTLEKLERGEDVSDALVTELIMRHQRHDAPKREAPAPQRPTKPITLTSHERPAPLDAVKRLLI